MVEKFFYRCCCSRTKNIRRNQNLKLIQLAKGGWKFQYEEHVKKKLSNPKNNGYFKSHPKHLGLQKTYETQELTNSFDWKTFSRWGGPRKSNNEFGECHRHSLNLRRNSQLLSSSICYLFNSIHNFLFNQLFQEFQNIDKFSKEHYDSKAKFVLLRF